ncbi:MAG: response regulator [Alphaproteobacteria bacterium]|jgi:DNA-binding NarL/FixJ family response regulator|nr:response regulator [Alphaproteobacteria bacterium]
MRILLADDHDLVRDALKSYLEREDDGVEVLTASSVPAAVEIIQSADRPIDIVILDFRMPGMNGLEGLGRVREAAGETPVAIMSGSASRDDIQGAMTRGAAGFLPKTLSGRSLLGAIRLIMTGERFFPASTFSDADGAAAEVGEAAAMPVNFTRRERDVLAYLFKGHSNKEIARALDLQEVTVKLHVRGLCRKLNAKNRTQAVLNARDLGISIEVDAP